jgi:hypothetical protein
MHFAYGRLRRMSCRPGLGNSFCRFHFVYKASECQCVVAHTEAYNVSAAARARPPTETACMTLAAL